MLEQLMLRRNIKITFPIRFGYRTIYVIFTTFIAITLVRRSPPALLRDEARPENARAPRCANRPWWRSARRPAPACRGCPGTLDAVSTLLSLHGACSPLQPLC